VLSTTTMVTMQTKPTAGASHPNQNKATWDTHTRPSRVADQRSQYSQRWNTNMYVLYLQRYTCMYCQIFY
jgi:hypothetical protein